jgi:chaperonin GroES
MLKPIFDYLFIKVLDEPDKTDTGLFKPVNTNERFKKAEVLEVGPGKYENGNFIGTKIIKGDTIVFDKNSLFQINVDNINYSVVRECHIIARNE